MRCRGIPAQLKLAAEKNVALNTQLVDTARTFDDELARLHQRWPRPSPQHARAHTRTRPSTSSARSREHAAARASGQTCAPLSLLTGHRLGRMCADVAGDSGVRLAEAETQARRSHLVLSHLVLSC